MQERSIWKAKSPNPLIPISVLSLTDLEVVQENDSNLLSVDSSIVVSSLAWELAHLETLKRKFSLHTRAHTYAY